MGSQVFYPYAVAAERLTLDIGAPADVPRGEADVLKVYQWDRNSESLPLALTVTGVMEALPELLPEEEQSDPPVQVFVTYESVEARRREAYPLPKEGNTFGLDLQLDLRDQAGEVLVQAVVARSAPSRSAPGDQALDRGARLAWSTVHRIQFDEPTMPPGTYIDVEWREFTKGDERLQRYANHLFALEMAASVPKLLLNRDFSAEAHRVLSSTGTHGKMARVRDATYHMIVHQVWSSLLAEALHEVTDLASDAGEGIEAESLLEDATEWKANVLRSWAPFLMPDDEPAAALEAVVEAIQSAGIDDLLIKTVPSAIQERWRTFRGFSGLVQEVLEV